MDQVATRRRGAMNTPTASLQITAPAAPVLDLFIAPGIPRRCSESKAFKSQRLDI